MNEGTDSSEYTASLEKLTANPIPEPPKKGFPNYYETTNSNTEKVTKKSEREQKGIKVLKIKKINKKL